MALYISIFLFLPSTSTATLIAALDGDQQPEMRREQLKDVSMPVEDEDKAVESNMTRKSGEKHGTEGLIPEKNSEKEQVDEKVDKIIDDFGKTVGDALQVNEGYEADMLTPERVSKELQAEMRKEGETARNTRIALIKVGENDDELERESRLVGGIGLQEPRRGSERPAEEGNIKDANTDESVEKEDHTGVSNLTPPLRTLSALKREEIKIPATIQANTQTQNPPSSPPLHHKVSPSVVVTSTEAPHVSTQVSLASPQFSPLSVTPNPVPTVDPGVRRSVSLLEDLLSEVLQNPGHHLRHNELEERSNLDAVQVKNMFLQPVRKEETTDQMSTREAESIPKVQAATPKPKDMKEPHPAPKINENNPSATPVVVNPNTIKPTGEPKLEGKDAKTALKQNKSSPPQPLPAKPPTKPQQGTRKAKISSVKLAKMNKSSKNKVVKKAKEKKKDNKTQKPPEKKKDITPTHFPYFTDNYCPPECACYGRVVQCSDKGVDQVPYGIPYNARYILLMNNLITSIQLDLLNEYVSMEFLVLSNNRLTSGAIEGSFEGIPALKRLYLDRNLLESVPNDLPVSLEELRLDNNRLSVMSEAAWARCPGLLVLSLSNNSLGNGSESLPDAMLSPLCNLRTLNLDHNQLKSVPLGLPLSIKELYFKGNLIEHFRGGAFDGKSELLVLDLSSNRLTNKGLLRESLVNATHLESLNLEGNRLKQVPKHLPRSLKTLNLEGNLISSIKKAVFSNLKNLEHLGLARNKIFKVAPGAFRALPILHQLDLCHNVLRQVPRQLPQALHSVALTHNRIQSVPRDAFCWGNRSLSLSGLVRVQLEHNLIDMGRLDGQAFRCLRGFQVAHFY
ncbi:extracellular matrix protein 2 [Cheilinus undulatus]|uniref:extracellular matrix protein 2 n=1 Tax=Cheilinus undulatus TaxID=241271 RepID=UPI001BD5748C|nr:extracellular matrix protein 2 [Cheilinus undulatus]